MSSTSLVTDGFICYGRPAPASLDIPHVTEVVEIRPTIRRVTPPDVAGAPEPAVISSQELKPEVSGRVTSEVVSTQPPKTRTAQELKPKIIKAEEED